MEYGEAAARVRRKKVIGFEGEGTLLLGDVGGASGLLEAKRR